MQEAIRLGRVLGLVPSFRNLYIWELAIANESQFASISLREAADRIIAIARISVDELLDSLDYFWFEDCRWRNPKLSFKERDDLRMREKARQY